MVTGLFDDVPENVYHDDRNSLSQSGIKLLLKSPALFRHEQEHPSEPTEAMRFGSAVHAYLLGGKVGTVAADSWRGQVAQDRRAALEDNGFVALLAKDAIRAADAVLAVREHPLASKLLDGRHEVSAYCVDEPTGVMRRGRFDCIHGDLLVDLKTAMDASPDGFAYAAGKYGYFHQHPYYFDLANDLGLDVRGFVFVVVESKPPHNVAVYELDADDVEYGRARNREGLQRFRDCTESGVWPGYSDDIQSISIPRYFTT